MRQKNAKTCNAGVGEGEIIRESEKKSRQNTWMRNKLYAYNMKHFVGGFHYSSFQCWLVFYVYTSGC